MNNDIPNPDSRKRSLCATVTISGIFLGGHPEIRPDLIPVRLHVGVETVVVEILTDEPRQMTWPSALVYDLSYSLTSPLFGAEERGEATPADIERTMALQEAGGQMHDAARFLLLQPREAGGGVLDVRFGFPDEHTAKWFIRRSKRSLGLDLGGTMIR